MCQGWRDSFESFFADVGERPAGKMSIDRIDNNGNYSCGHCAECLENNWSFNCRWADDFQQAQNHRNNHLIEYKGRCQVLAEWSRELGIDSSLLRYRLKHMTVEEAFERPIRKCGLGHAPSSANAM
jgi:hypothetical protein